MSWPQCHSRRSWDGGGNVYFCAHPLHHSRDNLVTLEICAVCPYWKEAAPPTSRPFPTEPPKPRGPCLHLGPLLELRDCRTCQGTVRVKVFACSHPRHAETTVQQCLACPDHAQRDPAPARDAGRGEAAADAP